MRAEIDRRAMALLSSGHLATDFANGALPALLPFLKERFSLSYTAVGGVVLASQASSSLIQPLFGLWSDRRGAMWLLPSGVALAGIGIALAADAPSYWLVLLLVLASGLGSAAFHPEGSKFAGFVSGRRRASGMAWFSLGGNVGYALGPVAATAVVTALGLRGGLVLAVPSLAVAVAILATTPYLRGFAPEATVARAHQGADDRWAMKLLLGVIALRSVAWFTLIAFVPLWEVSLGHSKSHGNHLLALMLFSGGVGTLLFGPLADRFGRKPVLLGSVIATGPLVLLFVLVGGVPGAIALALVGACIVGTFGVTMVMGQEYLPNHIGMASGLVIGLSVGLGGVAAVVLGRVADATSLRTALLVAAAAPVAAIALAAKLPPRRVQQKLEPVTEIGLLP
ncbi:MAG: MFS transporter [Actinobacteria bacterium]|nr:MAG: MFS transporter [Actinomycetota bacterium]